MSSGLPTPATSASTSARPMSWPRVGDCAPLVTTPTVLPVNFHRVAMAGRAGSLEEAKPDRASRRACRLHRRDRVTADELALVEFDGPAETGLERADVVGQLVAVERHPRLEAQACRARRAQSAPAHGRAGVHQGVPELAGPLLVVRRTRIRPRRCSQCGRSTPACLRLRPRRSGKVASPGQVGRRSSAGDDRLGHGSLDRDHPERWGNVGDVDVEIGSGSTAAAAARRHPCRGSRR